MNARAPSAPLTEEDRAIYIHKVLQRVPHKHWQVLVTLSAELDRRDADVFLAMRRCGFVRRWACGASLFVLPCDEGTWYYWDPSGQVQQL